MKNFNYKEYIKDISFSDLKGQMTMFDENGDNKKKFKTIEENLDKTAIFLLFILMSFIYPFIHQFANQFVSRNYFVMLYTFLITNYIILIGAFSFHSSYIYSINAFKIFLFKRYQIFSQDFIDIEEKIRLTIHHPQYHKWKQSENVKKVEALLLEPYFLEALKSFHLSFVIQLHEQNKTNKLYYLVLKFLQQKQYEYALLAFIEYECNTSNLIINQTSIQFYENLNKSYNVIMFKENLENNLNSKKIVNKKNKI